jgi:molybdate transport system regulatory protein
MVDVKAKIWLENDGQFILSDGRAEILRKVMETESLSEAAKSMNMSYSHAWSQVREMSKAAGGPLVKTKRGGVSGGRTRLTKLGKELLKKFDHEKEKLDRHLAERNR